MDPIILLAIGLAAIFLFRWADRKVGSDDPRPKSTGYGAVFLFGLACYGLNYLAGLPSLWLVALMAHGWIIYRSLPWKVGGSMTPRTAAQVVAGYMRHCLPALTLTLVLASQHPPGLETRHHVLIGIFLGLAFTWTHQQWTYGQVVYSGRSVLNLAEINAGIESHRGLLFGLGLAAVALFA